MLGHDGGGGARRKELPRRVGAGGERRQDDWTAMLSDCPAEMRDECELRYVLALATKAERAEYLERSERFDGKAHADALRARVAEAWYEARTGETPPPCSCEAARVGAAPVHPKVNKPGDGSFPHFPNEGPLRRDECVDSGAVAQ